MLKGGEVGGIILSTMLDLYVDPSVADKKTAKIWLFMESNVFLQVVNILIDICIKELEEKIAENILLQERFKPSIHESLHPYASALGVKLAGSVKSPGAKMLAVTFDPQCQTEPGQDVLMFYDSSGRILARRTGCLNGDWSKSLVVSGDELTWLFTTNSGGGLWGFRFTVTPSPPNENCDLEVLSDESILQEPCLELVKRLLGKGNGFHTV